jgi:cytochrome b561
MKTIKPYLAATELLLIFPAVLFMGSLVVRSLQPTQFEPAHTAQRIVDLYAQSVHVGLWVLLIAFPLIVLVTGCTALLRAWKDTPELRQATLRTLESVRTHLAALLVAIATGSAAAILVVVALHVLAD